MGLDSALKIGVFKEELKNRFRCVVTIDNVDTICYIPSSSRLSNFIDLSNRVVMLRPIKKKDAKTQYSVYAVKYNRSFVLLDLSSANTVIEKQLPRRLFNFLGSRARVKRETVIDDYKCDLYLEDSDTIIEIKSLLSFGKDAVGLLNFQAGCAAGQCDGICQPVVFDADKHDVRCFCVVIHGAGFDRLDLRVLDD